MGRCHRRVQPVQRLLRHGVPRPAGVRGGLHRPRRGRVPVRRRRDAGLASRPTDRTDPAGDGPAQAGAVPAGAGPVRGHRAHPVVSQQGGPQRGPAQCLAADAGPARPRLRLLKGHSMRILLVGAGGVGAAAAGIAARRDFFDGMVVADYDADRAGKVVARLGDSRFTADRVDASSGEAITELCRAHRITHVLNAVDPRFVMPVFSGAFAAGADYLDMAMSLSRPDPELPYKRTGVKLGDEQFAAADAWRDAGRLALVGIGVEPGLSDVFARYAADHLFSRIDEIGVRDGSNLVVRGHDFAPSFSIWTTIEECLNPPVIWEAGRGWYTTAPFSEPEVFDFPGGIGPVECVNVEHEEVLLIPRWIAARRVTFKYGLGEEFIGVLQTLHKLGLDSTSPVRVGGASVSPRDAVAAVLRDPATLGSRMTRATCG